MIGHEEGAANLPRRQILLDEVHAGMALPELRKNPTPTMLFRFSAVTWNAHRIHYDQSYARLEGHPDVLVQATMHGAFLLQMLRAFVGAEGQVLRFTYSNRARAVPGEVLVCGGRVLEVHATGEVDCEVWERKEDGTVCAPGTARLRLPRRP
ncbi:MaoC like domain-containing protein [Burkholderiales bacterium 8X]|nr:MaoC like domain-containing protein [Burkholderiales bacterium 8X]